ncbi:hypothetical protein [Microbacterium timonense]|uniref:hypothetical protein n=1 Tax=Microbacterium timonense TaxID=2086576 RepID=UPI000D10DFC2|nr:hypothetical protein [Microbacterium timonense]
MADEPTDAAAVRSALGTELFVLQSAASSTISEAGTRSAIYLSTLSGGLVAIGFGSSSPPLLQVLTLTVLPTVFALGWFTVVRLVDTSVENIIARRRMRRIRGYFASLDPLGALIEADDPRTTGELGVRYLNSSYLFTMATMVATVNAVLGGAIVSLLLALIPGVAHFAAVSMGIVVGVLTLTATLRYERRRIRSVSRDPDREP